MIPPQSNHRQSLAQGMRMATGSTWWRASFNGYPATIHTLELSSSGRLADRERAPILLTVR
jgi:hypothetical protein